jgi:hypothetical protein
MKIIVRDNLGKDVTYDREWYINTDGKIFYYTGDIDGPLYVVDNDYTWEMVSDGCTRAVSEEYSIYKYPFAIRKKQFESIPKADAKRILEAVERTKKYMRK